MSVLLDDASSEYLETAAALASAEPVSIGAWFYCDDDASPLIIASLALSSSNQASWNLQVRGDLPGDYLRAVSGGTEGWASAITTTGYTVNTWHHGLAVFAADDDRRVYIDGGSKHTEATTITTTAPDRFAVGRRTNLTPAGYFSGRVAEVGVWQATLDDDDAVALAAGWAPPFVKPHKLRAWYPLRNINDLTAKYGRGNEALTAYNTPTSAAHCRQIYPCRPDLPVPPGVVIWWPTGRLFLYTAANWGCPRAWYFEATMRAVIGTARAKLYDLTADADVASSEISTASATKTRVRSAAITLVDGHVYEARFGALSVADCSATGACLIGLAS